MPLDRATLGPSDMLPTLLLQWSPMHDGLASECHSLSCQTVYVFTVRLARTFPCSDAHVPCCFWWLFAHGLLSIVRLCHWCRLACSLPLEALKLLTKLTIPLLLMLARIVDQLGLLQKAARHSHVHTLPQLKRRRNLQVLPRGIGRHKTSASNSTQRCTNQSLDHKGRIAGAPAVRSCQAAANTRCHVLCSVGCRRLGTANLLMPSGMTLFQLDALEKRIHPRGLYGILVTSTVGRLSDAVAFSALCCRAQKEALEVRQKRCALLLHSALLYCLLQPVNLWHEAEPQIALHGLAGGLLLAVSLPPGGAPFCCTRSTNCAQTVQLWLQGTM
jgi:hypothetical protein